MLNLIKQKNIWFLISGILVVASIIVVLAFGLKPGIDFTGGTLLELRFEETVSSQSVKSEVDAFGIQNSIVQPINEKSILIKTPPLNQEEVTQLKDQLRENVGVFSELRLDSIGPTIGEELARKAYWQIALVIIGIILYIAYAFRKINVLAEQIKLSAWKLGLTTVAALVHDVMITIGVFAVLGKTLGVEIDTLFITALLTILGFSVHDTIVVFDRIRENLQKNKRSDFASIIDYAVNSTLARSINTTSTLVFVLLAMLFFGGSTIFYFVLALLIGVLAGTYSSIFLASPLLYVWNKPSKK